MAVEAAAKTGFPGIWIHGKSIHVGFPPPAHTSVLVQVYGCWIDSKSPSELERIWAGMQNIRQIVQNLPHENSEETISD